MRVVATAGAIVSMCSMWACASARPFDRLLSEQRWADAAQLFASDSTLLNDEQALYSAAVLFGSPTRKATYDPERARTLFQRLLSKFPNSKYSSDAQDRVALLDEVLRARTGITRVRELEARISELTAQQGRLRAELDSAQGQSDAVKRNAAKLEADVRDRDEQLRALRLELKQLKEIDLKPRSAGRRPPAD
jgi:FtsZ-binding cell division protein ZapB